jgi:hypothetical protein
VTLTAYAPGKEPILAKLNKTGGLVGLFHNIKILGSDPANWTTNRSTDTRRHRPGSAGGGGAADSGRGGSEIHFGLDGAETPMVRFRRCESGTQRKLSGGNTARACAERRVRRLRGFQRVTLAPGQTKHLTFRRGRQDVGFYDNGGRFVVEPGTIDVYVGDSSTADQHDSFKVR